MCLIYNLLSYLLYLINSFYLKLILFFCIDRFQCKLRWIQKQIKLYPCLDVGYKGIYEYDEFYKIVENKRIDVYKPIFFWKCSKNIFEFFNSNLFLCLKYEQTKNFESFVRRINNTCFLLNLCNCILVHKAGYKNMYKTYNCILVQIHG